MGHLSEIEWDRSADFERWCNAVFDLLRAELGGDEGQGWSVRRYGEGIFEFDCDLATGDAMFVIDHAQTHAKRVQSIGVEWRAYQPARVAKMLSDAYRTLERSADNKAS